MYFFEEITKLIMRCLNAKQKKQTQQSEVSLRYIKKHLMRDRTTTIAELIAFHCCIVFEGWAVSFFSFFNSSSFIFVWNQPLSKDLPLFRHLETGPTTLSALVS